MKSLRFLGGCCVLTMACAAPNASGPAAEAPEAGIEEPPAQPPTPDARPTPLAADAGAPPSTTPPSTTPPSTPPPSTPAPAAEDGSYACTRIIGINATAEWYNAGFESLVKGDRWELVRVHSGFVELWANPGSGAWSTNPTSPCAGGVKPDRIIFVALNFDTNTLEQWLPPLTAVVKNLRDKFPGLKRIELGTFVRAPGNTPCPQAPAKRSTIAAAEDQAIAMVAAANPDLVRVAPKFEAKTCGEFSGNPPHPSKTGGA
ncbi:MAG TPA: hypothetical protein VFK43_04520, partial [Acidimicrobiales bacterium]|nr:hypothetical protein [Acidimicrobiales bacterium]